MTQDWTALIAGERMQLDGEFGDRVRASSLSSQQWSLVMTATEFEIDAPGTPEDARLVANTDNLSAVTGEMARIERQQPGPGAESESDKGLFRRIVDSLGSGGSVDVDFDEAEVLADEYADRLQKRLVERGRWEDVCSHATSG